MKRNILVLSVFCLALALGACDQKDDTPGIAVVDSEKVYQNSQLAKKAMAHIEAVGKNFQERVSEMQAAVQADPENQELNRQLQAELMNLQGDFEARQTEAANKLNKAFEAAVEEYRQNQNLEVILPVQVVLASRPGSDATDAIIQILDAKNLDFGSTDLPKVVTPAPAPAPAGSAAAPADGPAPAESDAAPADGPAAGSAAQ